MALPRFLFSNLLVITPGVVLTASSQLASMPVSNVLKAGLSSRWRSASGWTFSYPNRTLRFNRGGVKTATIALSAFATGPLAAAAVQAALVAADPTPAWSVTYAGGRFTISSNLAFTLDFGTLVVDSAHIDLGYASVLYSGSLSYQSGLSYQSRHAIYVSMGTAAVGFTSTMVRGHNMPVAGTMTFQAHSLPMDAIGFSDPTVALTAFLTDYIPDPCGITFSGASIPAQRYLRLIIDNVANASGYSEIAVWFVGTPLTLTVLPSVQYAKDNEHLSEIVYAEGGAQMRVPRARRRVYHLLFQLEERNGLAVADRAIFDAIDALGIGTEFFANFDAPSTPALFVYGFMREGINEGYTVGTYWGIVMSIAEVLQVALVTGLSAYWRLIEASGSRADSIGTSTLTDVNTVTNGPGKIGPTVAAQFAGASSEALVVPLDNPATSMGVGVSWTIALWVFPTTRATLQAVISKDDTTGPNREYLLFINAGTGDLFFYCFQNNTTIQSAAFAALPLNVWSLVVGWFSTADSKVHLQVNNGTVSDSAGTITHTADAAAPFVMGGRSGADFFTGRLQHVALWKRALTSDERTALWNGGLGLDLAFFTPPPSEAPVIAAAAPAIGHGQLGLASGLRTFADLVGGAE